MKATFLIRNCAIGFSFLCFTLLAYAQPERRISGTVVSASDGKPIEAATIQILPGNRSVLSDADGKFSFIREGARSIRVSFVGFTDVERAIGTDADLSIVLEASAANMDEVVVVGYSTQKKVNLTGAVQTVRFDEAVNKPVTNSAQLMYGQFSGVQLTQSTGLPGSDNSTIVIRGVGTFGTSTPLVVIDNIQYNGLNEFNNLSPTDIESISVLKDASASAIYGARGANGVILVTTKAGKKGKSSIDYNNYFGFQRPTVVPQYLDAVDYATLRNERDRNANGVNAPVRFNNNAIEAIRNGSNPDQWSNTKWSDVILQDAPIMQHYLSFTGGGDATTFRISASYLTQDAIVKGKFNNDRYSLGISLSNKTNRWLSIAFNSNSFWARFTGPSGGPDAITGETGIINQFQRSSPVAPVFYSNGAYGFADGAFYNQNGNVSFPINNALFRGQFGDYENDNINTSNRFAVTANVLKDLSFETSGSVNVNINNTSNFTPTRTDREWAGAIVNQNELNSLSNELGFFYRLQWENILRYKKSFGDHNIGVMAGHSAIYDKTDGFQGSLQGFPSNAIQEFDGGGVVNPGVSGGANEVALQSFFGRVNYNYDEKYLLELNVRRDGSSRFGPNKRYGTFPSVSAGWNMASEGFMNGIKSINYLKLRGSWGLSGNDRIGNYIWEQNYNSGIDYVLGNGVIVPAVALTALANPNITWETIEQFNIGFDLGMFRNKFSLVADYFRRASRDILYTNFPVPNTIGVTNLAAQNAASMLNEGVEVNASFRHNFGALKMTLSGNVTWMADNEVTGLGPDGIETISGNNIIRIGHPLNAYYGYRVMGVFQTAEEVAGAPRQFGSNLTRAGDLRFADLSGPNKAPDGVIDANDRDVIGNPFPRWIYGFTTGFEFKGFDINAIFQGVSKLDRIFTSNGQLPMFDDRNNALSYWIDRWTPENPSEKLPRLGGVNNQQFSTFYVQDVSYLRLRNLEFGYTLPVSLSKKAGIQKFRVFVSGQNLLTFTKLDNFDPERATGGTTDRLTPLYKVFTTGVNLKF
ncbi:MAG TPA: TonB-dependent receptor [Phnomibacter sp.]|nr:TonB-dependent receptor [Phnomibacter sp.]